MLVLGICGGIASGKSKACQILVSHPDITNCILGYVDADQLAHSLYDNNNSSSPSVLLQQILREFGPTVFVSNNTTSSNLQLDRKALGNIVFSNPERMSVSMFF
jgi:dephospho-CoA kinase